MKPELSVLSRMLPRPQIHCFPVELLVVLEPEFVALVEDLSGASRQSVLRRLRYF